MRVCVQKKECGLGIVMRRIVWQPNRRLLDGFFFIPSRTLVLLPFFCFGWRFDSWIFGFFGGRWNYTPSCIYLVFFFGIFFFFWRIAPWLDFNWPNQTQPSEQKRKTHEFRIWRDWITPHIHTHTQMKREGAIPNTTESNVYNEK